MGKTSETENSSGRKKGNKAWKAFARVLLAIQLVASIAAIVVVLRLNMLPVTYVAAIGFLLFLLFFLADLLMIVSRRKRKKDKSGLYTKRGIGTVISVFTTILCIFATFALSKLITTIDGVTSDTIVVTESTAIYVMADDPAQNLNEAAGYTFGYTEAFDYENTVTAIEKAESDLNTEINKKNYESVVDMVAALYNGEVGAIFLNESYVDILEDMKEYTKFSSETRIISVSKVEIVQKVEEKVEDVTNESFVIYLSGSDTRNKNLAAKTRSDVNVIAVVNPDTKQVLLISTPRDYYIDISIASGAKDKLTHCGIYGTQCSMDTLGKLYNTNVDYYVKINFTGFEKLIDAIGGVSINVEKNFTSIDGYKYTKGQQNLSGLYALNYVRERHAFSDGDLARTRHQNEMIKAIIKKMSSGAIITNYGGIMDSIEGMFATDMSSDQISKLVKMQLSEGGEWNVQSFAVVGSNSKQKTYSIPNKKSYVMIPDTAYVSHAQSLIEKVKNGETLTESDVEMK